MPATVRQYELVYIVRADLSEEQVQTVINKYNGIVTTQGGTLERTDIWERRRLAYEIKGQSEGIYIVSVFKALPNVEAELRRVFRISEDTLRSIIVKPDEEIDTTVPSVQPREIAPRQPYGYHAHAPASAPASAVAIANAAAEAEAKAAAAEAAESTEAPVEEAEPEETAVAGAEPEAEPAVEA